jgi:hypothetical protein
MTLETDSTNTAKALQSTEMDLCPASVLYREARDLIRLCFDSVQVCHVPRSCNNCVRELACFCVGREPDQSHVWDDPLPSFVIDLVVREFAEPVVIV